MPGSVTTGVAALMVAASSAEGTAGPEAVAREPDVLLPQTERPL